MLYILWIIIVLDKRIEFPLQWKIFTIYVKNI